MDKNKHTDIYKEPHSFKGFEIWYHAFQMKKKMYFWLGFWFFVAHLALTFFFYFTASFTVALILQIMYGTKILAPVATFMLETLGLLTPASQGGQSDSSLRFFILCFVLASFIWVLYPCFIRKWKRKAEKIVQDEHMRGTKMVTDDRLAQMIMDDLKNMKGG